MLIERYTKFILRHRLAVVIATAIVTLFFGVQLGNLRLEIRRRANLPSSHPYVQIQNRISDLFGGEAVAIVGIVANQGTIYTPELLEALWEITEGIRDLPGIIEGNLLSLAAPNIKAIVTGSDGTLDIHRLLDGPPIVEGDINRLRADVRRDKLLLNNIVSADETATVVVADFDASVTDMEIAHGIEAVVERAQRNSFSIALAGAPILRKALTEYTKLIAILFPLAVVVIGLIHYEAFRSVQAMVLPLVTALLSVVWALGIMGFLNLPMDTWSAMTPVLILAVAAGHAVQILKRYYEAYAQIGDQESAILEAVRTVGPVMLAAGFIASAGFASLATFGVESVRVFGLLLAGGILSALVLEMTFTPACRSLLPAPKGRELERESARRWLDTMLEMVARVVVGRPYAVLGSTIVVVVAFAFGAARLKVDNSFRYWFPADTEVRRDDALLNEKLPGTATLRLLVEGKSPGILRDPGVLHAIDDLQHSLEAEPLLGGVTSVANYVKRVHQAMNGGDPTFYAIPDSSALITQYLTLYELSAGPEGLSAFVDANYRNAVIRALAKTDTAGFSRDLISRLEVFIKERFRDVPARILVAGGTLGVQTAMNDVVVEEKAWNVLQVSTIIFALTSLLLRSFVAATFVLIPLAVAVVVNLGVMGWTDTWLDMSTAGMTAMGVSIGADFAMYLIVRIRQELLRGRGLDEAIRESLLTSGKAIFFVSSAVAGGYMVLPLSGFSIWIRLGLLTATMVFVSAVATLTIIPSLALAIEPRFLSSRLGSSLAEDGLSGPGQTIVAEREGRNRGG